MECVTQFCISWLMAAITFIWSQMKKNCAIVSGSNLSNEVLPLVVKKDIVTEKGAHVWKYQRLIDADHESWLI